jgi:calmodulin
MEASSSSLLPEENNNNNNGSEKDEPPPLLPIKGDDGVYHILNRDQHAAFLHAHRDKLVVIKVYAPWCKACAGLAPKYLQLVQSPLYDNLPLVWADLSIQNNKNFVKELSVLALPSILFYVGDKVAENFPCGPSKLPILKRKLAQLINSNVDPATRKVKSSSSGAGVVSSPSLAAVNDTLAPSSSSATTADVDDGLRGATTKLAGAAAGTIQVEVVPPTFNDTMLRPAASILSQSAVGATEAVPATQDSTAASWKPASLTAAEQQRLISKIPFLQELSLADLEEVLARAKLFTFDAGTVIMREGNRGRTFYILAEGEVEICQRTQYDPLVTADSYLGSVINRLGPGDYFGERSLLTGEPRAASIRASERTTCIVFDRDDFPASSILSGRTRNVNGLATSLETANDKYGVALSDLLQQEVMQQIRDASSFSQTRGSPNSPKPIMGVDTEEEELILPAASNVEASASVAGSYVDAASMPASFTVANKEVMALLSRFQMIRHVSQCLDYLEQMRIKWGDEGSRLRRSILVNRLPVHQKRQFRDTFQLIDVNGDGTITLMELKQVMSSIGETKSDEELRGIFISGREMTEDDFLGIMAEAEFYTLFRDIFVRLDPYDTGFVRARDLDRVLCGVRDLISDDRKSIIDVEDDEMLIDYEQFSRMLLGSALA